MFWIVLLFTNCSLGNLISPHVTLDDQSPHHQVSFHNDWATEKLLLETKSLYVIKDTNYDYACNVSSPGGWLEYERKNEYFFNQSLSLEQEKKDAIQTIKSFAKQRQNLTDYEQNCVSLADRYWAYKYCYDHRVLQYHYDQNLYMQSGRLILQKGSPMYTLASVGQDPYDKLSDFELIKTNDGSKYLTQVVYNGSTCDLTGEDRVTTIHYKCNAKLKNPKIDSIEELQTCKYKLVISAPQFCENPTFRPARDMTTANVSCFPIKPEDGFEELEQPFKHSPLDINNISLNPAGFGVFLGQYKINNEPTANIQDRPSHSNNFILTHKVLEFDPENPEVEQQSRTELLSDIATAFSFLIQNNRLNTPSHVKPNRTVNSTDKFLFMAEVYGLDMEFIDHVMISQGDGGFIVAYFEGEKDSLGHYGLMNILGNFLSFE